MNGVQGEVSGSLMLWSTKQQAFGPATVTVSHEVASLMEEYFRHIRGKITPQNSVRFFLTNTGNEFCKISECMRVVAESFGVSLPTSGLQRKVVASESEDNVVVHICTTVPQLVRSFISTRTSNLPKKKIDI